MQTHLEAGRRTGMLAYLDRLATSVAAITKPDNVDWRPFGVDLWQGSGVIDWDKLAAFKNPPVDYVILRSGQGHPTVGARQEFYEDAKFIKNVQEAVRVGIPWMQYHVFLPNYIDTRYQVNYAFDRAQDAGDMPLCLWWDHELKNGVANNLISSRLEEVIYFTDELYRDIPLTGIYTGRWVIDQYSPWQSWMEDMNFWIASWSNTREKPALSDRDLPGNMKMSQVKIHQTTARGDGYLLGTKQQKCDYNRAMDPKKEFYEWLGVAEAPVPSSLDGRVSELEEWRKNLQECFQRMVDDTHAIR